MHITEEHIEKEVLKRGYSLHKVEGCGTKSRITISCHNCGVQKTIRYTSLWHQSKQCLTCSSISPDLKLFEKYLELGQWELLTTFKVAADKITLRCLLCQKTRELKYHSFMSKPQGCKHSTSYYQMRIESDFNLRGFRVHSIPPTRRTSTTVTCRLCNTTRKVSFDTVRRVGGCAECKLRAKLLLRLPTTTRITSRQGRIVGLICKQGHEYRVGLEKAFRPQHLCPQCRIERKNADFQKYIKETIENQGFKLTQCQYKSRWAKVDYSCPNGHSNSVVYHTLANYSMHCKQCDYQFVAASYLDKIKEGCAKEGYECLSSSYSHFNDRITIRCPAGHQFEDSWVLFRQDPQYRCHTCKPYLSRTSKGERELLQWATANWTVIGDTKVGDKSYDICFPEQKLLVEFDGLYWHSCDPLAVDHKAKTRHISKYLNALDHGYKFLAIREDEWGSKEDILKSLITARAGKLDTRIYARNCGVIKSVEAGRDFLIENHLQGAPHEILDSWGLTNNGTLVALATVSRHHRDSSLVLSRICYKKYHHIVGGLSRLISYVPRPITTWSDNRYASGEGYKKTGFEMIAELPPDYEYTRNGKRYSKQSLRKRGFEKTCGLTEFQLRSHQGYRVIYNYGKKRWLLR